MTVLPVEVPQHPSVALRNPWTSVPRRASWQWRLLDRQDRQVARVEHIEAGAGSLEWSIHQTVRSYGQVRWEGPPEMLPDWRQHRLQARYILRDHAGEIEVDHPMGVYLVTHDRTDHAGYGTIGVDLKLRDKLSILERPMREPLTISRNTRIDTAIRDVILDAGETRVLVDDLGRLRNPMTWDAGESRLRVVNDLAAAGNALSATMDGTGAYRIEKSVPAGERPLAWEFAEGEASIIAPGISVESNLLDIPNVVILVAREDDDDAEPMRAVAEDMDSPWGIEAAGENPVFEDNVEAETQTELDAMAVRRLEEVQAPHSVAEIQHALIPMALNARVTVAASGTSLEGVVQSYTVPFDTGADVTTRIRQIGRWWEREASSE